MPGYDRTGPWGYGPMTGWGMGLCRGGRGVYGRGFGPGYGRGRGFGRGWGRGFGGRFGWGGPYFFGPAGGGYAPGDEKAWLEEEAADLRARLSEIDGRLGELSEAEAE